VSSWRRCSLARDEGERHTYLGNVTFSCAAPKALGGFWREALGYVETQLPPELEREILAAGVDPAEFGAYSDAVPPDRARPRLLFQRREKTPAQEPALRLELATDDVEAEADRLARLGAKRLGTEAFLDPEGNAFTLVANVPG
jgi:hypothetical protein